MTRRLLAACLGAALVAGTTAGAVAGTVLPASAAGPAVVLLAGTTPATTPFPDDRWTVADASQTTGRRVALPTDGCDAQGRSLCDDLAQINQLDGFDLQPRVTLPFSGAVDLLSVTPSTVYVESAAGRRTGLVQLVFDPTSNTVSGTTDALLDPAASYVLVVTAGLRAVGGGPVDPCGGSCPVGTGERRVPFTTMDPYNTLDEARRQLDDGTAASAAGISPQEARVDFRKTYTDGTLALFGRAEAGQIMRQDQTSADPAASKTTSSVPNASTATRFGVGSIVSPQYVDGEGVVPPVPTGGSPSPLGKARIGVTMMAGAAPVLPSTCLRPVVFGPGFTRSKYDLFLSADGLPERGFAVFATDPLGHSFGPASTFTVPNQSGGTRTGSGFGRGKDLDGDGLISSSEGVGPTFLIRRDGDRVVPDQPNARAAVGLRDGLIQTVVDNMALVRALEQGVDVTGDGVIDTCTGDRSVSYFGQSFGGIYGTMLLGTDPQVDVGVPNVPGGPVIDIARESGFRRNAADVLQANKPNLLNGGPGLQGFTESLPLRLDPRVTDPVPGALAVQQAFARGMWVSRAGSPETYAPRLATTGVFKDKKVIVQVAYTDGTVPNPTSGTLLRAGDLYPRAWVYRNDRTPTFSRNPHGFLLDPTIAGRNQGQQQIAEFLVSGGATTIDPDGASAVWENAATGAYRVQLDCLHYPDPQTGQPYAVTPNTPDCSDRSGTVTAAQGAGTGGRYHPLVPARILDTRTGDGAVAAGADRTVQVTGQGGVPAEGVRAVVVNATVPLPAAAGDLQVFPAGSKPARRTSNLNWTRGRTKANAVTVGVGPDGRIGLSVVTGSAHVVLDVLGWYGDAGATAGSALLPLRPARVLDTRTTREPVRAGADRRLPLLGRGGVPASGVDGVVLSLVALGAERAADVQVYPTGDRPTRRTSSTNVVPGQTVAAHVPSALGSDGSVTLSVSDGSVSLVADVLGYYGSGSSRFVPLVPRRVLDTRTGEPVVAGADRAVLLAGSNGIPDTATAVIVNTTAVRASVPLDLQVYPTGDRPDRRTSVLNLRPGQAVPNLVLARLSSGSLTLSASNGRVDVVLDVVGYLTG